mgnify:CR=1 FL=1
MLCLTVFPCISSIINVHFVILSIVTQMLAPPFSLRCCFLGLTSLLLTSICFSTRIIVCTTALLLLHLNNILTESFRAATPLVPDFPAISLLDPCQHTSEPNPNTKASSTSQISAKRSAPANALTSCPARLGSRFYPLGPCSRGVGYRTCDVSERRLTTYDTRHAVGSRSSYPG